jgi:crossover junction endodeoxyribonuclease RuvC
VKQAVTGRGRATKEQVALMVRALVGLRRPPRADAADALAVAVAHAHIRKDRKELYA